MNIETIKAATAMLRSDSITMNEFRTFIGEEPIENGNEIASPKTKIWNQFWRFK